MTPKHRFASAVVAVFVLSASVSSVMLYRDLQREDCGLQARQARAMVVEDLRSRGQPLRDLAPTGTTAPCRYAFRYTGDGARVDYAVGSDWRHGVQVVRRTLDDSY